MHTDDYLTVNAVLHGDKDGYGKLVNNGDIAKNGYNIAVSSYVE